MFKDTNASVYIFTICYSMFKHTIYLFNREKMYRHELRR